MSATRSKPQSRIVDINKLSELRAWAKYWGCTQLDVRDAVWTSGVMVEDVQDWLVINVVRCAQLPPLKIDAANDWEWLDRAPKIRFLH